ncbi:MAG: DUF4864 domain-containing protein [Rhodospirillaceae bacterium]|nr:DUF4864 domain-containing protein [Rhodospirillaceae bacterium]
MTPNASRFLTRFWIGFFAVMLIAAPVDAVRADDGATVAPDSAAAGAIRNVIENQFEAFLADDGARAFSFASPDLQVQFGSPDVFMSMVRTGYAPVYRPQDVEFLDLLKAPSGFVQQVHVVGTDGTAVIAHYLMEQQPDGSWRIDGCMLTQAPDLGV